MTLHVDSRTFLAWAKTRPAGETYDYTEPGNCALALYLQEQGRTKIHVGPFGTASTADGPVSYDRDLEDALIPTSGDGKHRHHGSFTNLVARLEEVLHERV